MTLPDSTLTVPAPSTAQAIGYRPESSGLAESAVDVLLVLVLLLGGLLALAWFARQKGWLQRWTTGVTRLSPSTRDLRIEQVLRLSPRTTLFRVVDGKKRHLLVESTGSVKFLSSGTDTAGDGANE